VFENFDIEKQDSEHEGESNFLGVTIAACTLPVVFVVWAVGNLDMALNTGICLGMNILAVGNCWELRKFWWFWCVIGLMIGLNVPLIIMVHWPHQWVPRVALLPIGLADMGITVGAVRFVQHFIVRYKPPDEDE
jgi:hypothetical protein